MIAPIQVKRHDVTEDARILAELMGVSITDAIASAVRSRLDQERELARQRLEARKLKSLVALRALHELPVVGPLLTDEDLYGADGLPK